jgi:glycosyltransferase involved in cell wall biosynthesis
LRFSIITPSFRQLHWLKLCVASVADQNVEVEHIVQDAQSDDGTEMWLQDNPRIRAFVEKDNGMYDAINRGYSRADGDIFAHLNCDEQYLPGALETIESFFSQNPRVDVVFAGSIVVNSAGDYICHKHSMLPNRFSIWWRFPVLTSSLFIRRRVIRELGILFNPKWKAAGDVHWLLELMNKKVSMAVLDKFVATFTDTGENLGTSSVAHRENSDVSEMAPRWAKLLKPMAIAHHRSRRLLNGHFFLKKTSYSIYTLQSPTVRVLFNVYNPTAVWWDRL